MTFHSSARQLVRVLLALIAAPLASAITYTLISYGIVIFFPLFYFVAGVALSVTLLVFVPVYIVLLARWWTSFLVIVGASFFVTFAIFVIVFLVMTQGFTSSFAGGEFLVKEGRVTMAGYVNVFRSSLIVAMTGAVGGLVFWLIAHYRMLATRYTD